MGRRMVLSGGGKPHLRKASRRNWTLATQAEFLARIAETCNVTEAARRTGVSISYAYKKRAADARFRAAWKEAIGFAYHRLELMLLDRAFNGTIKVVRRKDGTEERMREYPNQLGLALLKMHRDAAAEAEAEMEFPAESAEEIRERLVGKLKRLKARNDAEDSADG